MSVSVVSSFVKSFGGKSSAQEPVVQTLRGLLNVALADLRSGSSGVPALRQVVTSNRVCIPAGTQAVRFGW